MQGGGDADAFSSSAVTIKSEKINHLRDHLSDFFLEWSSNKSTIRELDVTGHLMGDKGAVALSKLIQQTNVLKRYVCVSARICEESSNFSCILINDLFIYLIL
jgi:hypothetical protein